MAGADQKRPGQAMSVLSSCCNRKLSFDRKGKVLLSLSELKRAEKKKEGEKLFTSD